MLDRRKTSRIHLVYYLAVFDRKTGKHIGYLSDITSDNAMVLTEKPLETDTDYQLKIEPISESYGSKFIEVDAGCTRCDFDKSLDFYHCGFTFLNINPDDFDEIEIMGKKLGFGN